MTPTDARLEDRLSQWIADSLKIAPAKISASTRLNLDLGVDGDDGVDLMRSFGEAFGVDVSDFPYSRYFGPEASHPFGFFSTALRFLSGRSSTHLQPLYVSDLVNMVKKANTK
jgi:acyl carrier protein